MPIRAHEVEGVNRSVRRWGARWRTSSITLINDRASFLPRHPTVSDTFPLEKISSIRGTSSPSGTVQLTRRCRARLPEPRMRDSAGVGKGDMVSSARQRSSSRDEFGTGESDSLNCLLHSHHVSILPQVRRYKTLT